MEAILARYEGKVGLMVVVDENGKVRDFKVIRAWGQVWTRKRWKLSANGCSSLE